jgi:hypothetical protein
MENREKLRRLFCDEQLDKIWDELQHVPFDFDDTGEYCLSVDFYIWEAGTSQIEIWYWFNSMYLEGLVKRHFNNK